MHEQKVFDRRINAGRPCRKLGMSTPPRMYCDGMSRITRLSLIHGWTFAFTYKGDGRHLVEEPTSGSPKPYSQPTSASNCPHLSQQLR